MKVILSGGGTGGHIYPALTIADQIKKLQPEAEVSFVGTRQGLEKDIIPRYGYKLQFIEVAGFKRSPVSYTHLDIRAEAADFFQLKAGKLGSKPTIVGEMLKRLPVPSAVGGNIGLALSKEVESLPRCV